MPLDRGLLREHAVGSDAARRHAAARLLLEGVTQTPGLGNWVGASLGEPTLIYDPNGEPLFHDFPVVSSRRQRLGLVRASANRVLGVGALALYVGAPPWDLVRATQRVMRIAVRSRRQVHDSRPVCYAYPKLGIDVRWRGPNGEEGRTIYDAADLSVVPERTESGLRGPGVWSIYEAMSEEAVRPAVERFAWDAQLADHLEERTGEKLMVAKLDPSLLAALVKVKVIPWWVKSHLALTLHGQETSVWCTVATGQMILEYLGYNFTQTQIAQAMGTGSGGTTWGGEETGLESLTSNQYDASSDFAPTFDKARVDLDAQHPFDYSYPYHSMACAGYKYQNIYLVGTQPVRSLELYDPWPPNVGTIRWETWGAAYVEGFVTLRPV